MSENGFESIREGGEKEKEEREREERQSRDVEILVGRLRDELGLNIALSETSDAFEITLKDIDGGETKEVFLKLGGKIPVGEQWHAIGDVIEARLRYPDEKLSEAIRKIEK